MRFKGNGSRDMVAMTAAQVRQFMATGLLPRQGRAARTTGGIGRTQLASVKADWCCRHTDCPYAVNEKANYGTRGTCNGCGRAKATAMSPPLALAVPPREPTVSAKAAKGASQVAARQKANDKTDKDASSTSTVAATRRGPSSPAPGDPPGPVATTFAPMIAPKPASAAPIPAGADEAVRVGLTPLQDLDPSALYPLPPVVVPGVGTLEDLMAKTTVLEATGVLTQCQEEVAALRQALALLPPGNPGRPGLEDELAKGEAKVLKLSKRAPSTKLQVEHLRSAKQAQKETEATQEQRAVAGQAKALERHLAQLAAIDEYVAALTDRRKGIADAFTNANAQWRDFHGKKKVLWSALYDQIDAKVAELELLAAMPTAVPMAADPGYPPLPALELAVVSAPPPPGGAGTNNANDELAKVREEARVTKEALASLQQSVAVYRAQLQALPAGLAPPCATPQAMTLQLAASDLPTMLPEPLPDHWPLYHRLWCTLEMFAKEDALGGPPLPITIAQLQAGVDIIKTLVGDAIWNKAYPNGTPSEDALITLQLRQLCWTSLNTFRDKLLQDKAKQEAESVQAATHVQAVVTEARAKRRRAEDGAAVVASPGAVGSASSA